MRAKIRQLFCLIVIVIIALAIGAAAINVYMVWGTKGRILKKDGQILKQMVLLFWAVQ